MKRFSINCCASPEVCDYTSGGESLPNLARLIGRAFNSHLKTAIDEGAIPVGLDSPFNCRIVDCRRVRGLVQRRRRLRRKSSLVRAIPRPFIRRHSDGRLYQAFADRLE
jgi:hypothetical protein